MKNPNLRLVAKRPVDGSENICVVPGERGNVVLPEISNRIPPVIPEVVEDEIEPVAEQ
jgi:hypothetical protein